MSFRSVARGLVPPIVTAANRRLREGRWHRRSFSAVEPFSEAYVAKRDALVAALLRIGTPVDQLPLLGLPRLAQVDERPIEYTWAFEVLRGTHGGRLLDVGCVLNKPWCAPFVAPLFDERCYLNLAHEPLTDRGHASMLVADARDMPFPDGWFDALTCLSTLEHVGMDNSLFTTNETYAAPVDGMDLWARAEPAVHEFRRVVRPGGRIAITVPYGRSEDRGWFQVFDAERIELLRGALGPESHVDLFAVDRATGWHRATLEEAAPMTYGSGGVAATAVACVSYKLPSTE